MTLSVDPFNIMLMYIDHNRIVSIAKVKECKDELKNSMKDVCSNNV